MKKIKFFYPFAFCLFLFSCSTTKYIPEGQYLLDKISLQTDSNAISKTNLLEFVQQKPNDPKLGLMIYNWVDNDSSWFKKMIRKIGNPPVIFSQRLLNQSLNEMTIEMKNRGYLNAYVHAVLDTAGKKISAGYHIHEGIPYRIRNYEIRLPDEAMNNSANGIRIERDPSDSTRFSHEQNRRRISRMNLFARNQGPILKTGTIFDMTALERERTRVSNRLRNSGYYLSTIDNLHYLADTALQSNEVNLTLIMKDTTQTKVFGVEKVKVFSGYDFVNSEDYTIVDSVAENGIDIYYDKFRFLRPKVIADKILIRPGGLFREQAGESTLSLFQALNCVGRADVKFKEGNYADSTLLDCEIYLAPGEMHTIQTGLSGTNKAGDLGISADINYGNLNLFNGSEQFNIRLNGAYEFVRAEENDALGHNFYEFGITPSLTFSKIHLPFITNYFKDRYNPQTQYRLGFNIQKRPQYIRDFFNFNWQFRWSGHNNIATHTIDLIDVNYVAIPWKSTSFQDYLNNHVDSLTRYSYENIFTAGSSYNLIYTNANSGQFRQHLYTVRFNAEFSGNALNGIFLLAKASKNENGQYEIFKNPFAQYLKGDIDYSETIRLSETGGVAFHAGLGLAYPYGNSSILPFEKRYYAGGPNSVRGWRTRYLGPGSLNKNGVNSMAYHVGDINFILSAEYRYKILDWLEPALFVDCGNIWTIKDYPNQPGGLFKWDSFYKELAVGTGIGLRFDLSFLILRFDVGTRVYDPGQSEGNRYVFMKENIWNNSAMYVAIGYPF
ncbi:MAG: outer membrane protein assembly factor [Dysgonamonadaceae bacterium]|jgi:outer membrane protein assembly factor BamA|nr:outer membrane protein assembly factor [Dysgonamonadaceae bacterium]